MNILQEIRNRFAAVLVDFTENPERFVEMVKPSQDPRHGDFQANCAMPLAQQNGTNPRELAARIVERLDVTDLCTPPEIAGPGFINLFLRDEWLEQQVNLIAEDDRLGVPEVSEPRRVVVDFSSPNVAKPMHVGHLRSTVIGDALQRVLRFLGHHVVTDNHIGDWGTQFGMIIYGYKHFVDEAAYQAQPVQELARLYRLVSQLSSYPQAKTKLPQCQQRVPELQERIKELEQQSKTDKALKKELKKANAELVELRGSKDADGNAVPGVIEQLQAEIAAVEASPALLELAERHPDIARLAREETAKLHAGDAVNKQLWDQFLPHCLEMLNSIYDRLNIRFDHTLGESFYNPWLSETVTELTEQGLATESAGAKCIFIEGNAAPFIIQKADGAYTYATTDLATIRYRVREWDADAVLYVVDSRQAEHFKLLFATAKLWGYKALQLYFVNFGTVMGKDNKPFKTRSGDNVGLESLLDEAVIKAREIVATSDDAKTDAAGNPAPELGEHERDRIAEIVGLGGIKYADLHHNRESDYVFDWNKMLAKTGDTATYMQYAYARIHGIFRKGEIDLAELRQAKHPISLKASAERALALKLCRFGDVLDAMIAEFKPNVLTQYLYELANELTTFYGQCHVLNADTAAERASRLRLVDLSGRIIKQGLNLLGIETSERM